MYSNLSFEIKYKQEIVDDALRNDSFCIKRVECQISIVTFFRRLLDVSRVKFGEFFLFLVSRSEQKSKKKLQSQQPLLTFLWQRSRKFFWLTSRFPGMDHMNYRHTAQLAGQRYLNGRKRSSWPMHHLEPVTVSTSSCNRNGQPSDFIVWTVCCNPERVSFSTFWKLDTAGIYSSQKSCQASLALSTSSHGIGISAFAFATARHALAQPCASTLYHGELCGSVHPQVTPHTNLNSRPGPSLHFPANASHVEISVDPNGKAAAFNAVWSVAFERLTSSSQQAAKVASSFILRKDWMENLSSVVKVIKEGAKKGTDENLYSSTACTTPTAPSSVIGVLIAKVSWVSGL